jgi:hypothetical protein
LPQLYSKKSSHGSTPRSICAPKSTASVAAACAIGVAFEEEEPPPDTDASPLADAWPLRIAIGSRKRTRHTITDAYRSFVVDGSHTWSTKLATQDVFVSMWCCVDELYGASSSKSSECEPPGTRSLNDTLRIVVD